MKTNRLLLRAAYLSFSVVMACACSPWLTLAQEKPSAEKDAGATNFPAAKKAAPPAATSSPDANGDGGKTQEGTADKDGPDAERKRDEWFYKQRASVNGRIPAGARFKAFQHMQKMMAAEGKLVLRPDATYAEAANPAVSPASPAWTSIGPTPTLGGEFSPVTGRITTIAVDPSDATGNTLLIGGAQGGIWRSTDAGVTWTAVGDQNASLAMGSIAFAPSQTGLVYAGTGEQAAIGFDIYSGAGVLSSTDHGATWTQTCTVAGPTCPFIGPYLDSLNPSFGFYNFGGARISYLAVNPQNPQLLLAAAELGVEGPTEGIYCSNDGGAHWSNIFPDETATFVGFASPTVAFAAFGTPFGSSTLAPHGNGIYKSTNANSCSATFTPLAGGLPSQTSIGRIDMGISPNFASDSTVYASIGDASSSSTQNLGVWVTSNGGTTWTQTSAPDICQQQCWYDNVIKVDPTNGKIAYFGGSAAIDGSGNPQWVVRTTNGGTSWSSVIPNQLGTGLPHVDTHALAFFKLPTGKVRLYMGNDGGIWRTDDAEATPVQWTNLNGSTLSLTQFYPTISVHPSTPLTVFGGTQDNSSQQLTAAPAWGVNTGTFQSSTGPEQVEVCGDGTSTAIDPNVPSTVYISCQFSSVNASYLTGAPGSFFPAVNGIDLTESAGFVPPMAADPNQANVVYFGAERVYQSVDAANSWVPISPFLGGNGNTLTALAIGAQNSSVIYAGTNNGIVFVATGFTNGNFIGFQNSTPTNSQARGVTAIAVDPSDSTGMTAYASFTGFAYVGPDALNPNVSINDPAGHIFKTTNGGQNWTDVSCSIPNCSVPAMTDLPNIPVNDVVIDPDVAGTIYAATDLGVYVGNCTVVPCTWSTLGTGLPHVAVLSMRLHEASRTLVAATHGRGAWEVVLNNFSFSGPHISSITPTSASSGASPVSLTVNGTGLTGGIINFGGTPLTTTAVQAGTQLTATVPTSALIAGSQKVTVTTGAASSNALPFEVLALTPTLASCTSSVPAASSASCGTPVQATPSSSVQLTLTGTNFATGAKTLFNTANSGISSQTNSSSKLTATIPSALLGPFGSTNDISVLNTPPGGGKSSAVTFQVVAPPPANDTFASATNITTLNFNDLKDSSNAAATSAPIPPCVNQYGSAQGNTGGHMNGTYNVIWYQFTPIFSANLEVDTIGSSYDTVLSIWTGTQSSLTNLACNDDIVSGVNIQSQLTGVPLTAGTTYYIMVSSFGPPDPNPIALGGRSQLNFSYNGGANPSPTLTSITPVSTSSGGPDVALTVNGSGFLNGAVVIFQNTQTISTNPLITMFVSTTQLKATIPAALFVLPGPYSVSAVNPQPSDGPSNSESFTVNLGTYPVPILSSIFPTTIVAGSFGFGISASGNNFAPGAVLNFNGMPMPTMNSGGIPGLSLSATIPASAIVNAGTAQVTIVNPAPGGGPSAPLPFSITPPTTVPTISSISPASIPPSSPTSLTINGAGFLQGAFVLVSGNSGNVNVGGSYINSGQIVVAGVSISTPGTYSLYVVDPSPAGTSAAATFTVTGPPDFSFTVAAGQGSQTVSAGQTATFTNAISVTAMNGFTGQVVASCSSPAQATACTVMPSTINAGQSASIMVTTTARSVGPPLRLNRRIISWQRLVPVMVVMLLCVLLTRLARTRRQRMLASLPLAGVILFLVLQAVGCGGGGYTAPPPPTGTQAGTYTITVTGTSAATNTTHTATLQLVVN